MKNQNKYFILMVDVVKSRSMQGNVLMDNFKELVDNISKIQKSVFLSPPTITLGDEFQSVVKTLKDGIDTIIMIEELLIKSKSDFKLRYVLNYGVIETKINPAIAYEMLGEGLTTTRELLSGLKKEGSRFFINLNSDKSELFNGLFYIYSSIVDKWKYNDYKLVNSFIINQDYKKVAKQLNRDRASTWRKEKTLQMKQYFVTKILIKKLIKL